MDPYVLAGRYRGADSVPVALTSSLCALVGLGMAVAGTAADSGNCLLVGVAVGVFGPVVVRLGARRVAGDEATPPGQAGLPFTATTTDRSRLPAPD
jgi:hypothetical protein